MTLNSLSDDVVGALRDVVPASALRDVPPAYLQEPRGRWSGQAGILVTPDKTQDVASVIRIAAQARVGVVPYGGGTGLVGGQVSPDGPAPILLSLERMTRMRAVYPDENVLVVEAGAILSDVHAMAEDAGRLYPLSIAAKGSARIGGILATNAGGVNVLRYGNARDLCLGIEAVLPDGQIWNGLKRLRKDNTGYDLRNLLIGSEGTLGVITAAALKLVPKPTHDGTAILAVNSPAAALSLLHMAQQMQGDAVSAFELIHRQGIDFMSETGVNIRAPFAEIPDWMVLVEFGLAEGQDPVQALTNLFERALNADLVSDGVIAQSEAQRQQFWDLREHIPEGNRRIGSISSHDISLPLSLIPEFIAKGAPALAKIGNYRINCFGHLGDGNLHYNVFPMPGHTRAEHRAQVDNIKRCVHDLVHAMGGSISAEHGIGRLKVSDLERYGDPAKLSAMRAIKSALDPVGIMNPGAVLRAP